MTLEEFASLFEKYKSEYRKFKNIEYPNPGVLCNHPDLHAFIMLNNIISSPSRVASKNLISSVGHDCFYFNIDCEKLVWKISTGLRKPEDVIIDLIRCGVMYDKENKWLWMFT